MPCVDGACVAHPKKGETCDSENRSCIEGLACHMSSPTEGTCGDPLPLGSPCDPSIDGCDFLKNETCDPFDLVCTKGAPAGSVGEPCNETDPCNFASYCGAAGARGVCKLKPREGEPCLDRQVECLTPARCIDGVCKLRDAAVCK
jgi:hypothetical protein